MAESSIIKTSIWDDDWFFGLDDREVRLWFFLLTTSSRTLAGVYHLPLRRILYYNPSFDRAEIIATLARFQIEGRIFYKDDWIVMINHFKHQNLGGPKQWGAVNSAINNAPDWLRERLLNPTDTLFMSIDTVSKGYIYSIGTVATKIREDKISNTNTGAGSAGPGERRFGKTSPPTPKAQAKATKQGYDYLNGGEE